MVVSANLKASFSGAHIRSSGKRMRLLSERLLTDIEAKGGAYRPDVLLLQEALTRQSGTDIAAWRSGSRLAGELSRMTGDPYTIVVDPGTVQAPAKNVSKETMIVANLATMQRPTAAGFVASHALKKKFKFKGPGPDRAARAPSRRQAWGVIAEAEPQGKSFAVASVHFLTDKRMGCPKGASCQPQMNRLKAHWSKQVSDTLNAAAGNAFTRAVIGGDWNATRKERWFGEMIQLGYSKAIRGRIDYIFTRGTLGLTGIDGAAHSGRRGYPLGYSDHRFLWATLG
jgi:hypothetical protein